MMTNFYPLWKSISPAKGTRFVDRNVRKSFLGFKLAIWGFFSRNRYFVWRIYVESKILAGSLFGIDTKRI